MFWIHHSDNAIQITGHFFHLDRAKPPVSDHTYIFCKLSFCQKVSEMIYFLGSGVRKWIPQCDSWVDIKKRVIWAAQGSCGIKT